MKTGEAEHVHLVYKVERGRVETAIGTCELEYGERVDDNFGNDHDYCYRLEYR